MRLLRYLLYVFALNLIELLLCIAAFAVLDEMRYGRGLASHLESALRDSLDINGARFVFYEVLFLIFFIIPLESRRWWRRNSLRTALLNSGLYIALSLLFSVLLPFTAEFLTRDFFPVLIGATFLSPLLLNLIPAFRRVVTGEF